MIANETFMSMLDNPVREIKARAELYEGSALIATYSYTDRLKSFTVDRIGESKFFGFGVCKKLNLKLIDTQRELSITTANNIKIAFGVGEDYIYTFPTFYVTEVHRDENTGELSVTAYDAINEASKHTMSEINMTEYNIYSLALECAELLGLGLSIEGLLEDTVFNTYYEEGANLEGSENIREVFTAIAEATQTIYYIDAINRLVFKRLSVDDDAVFTIDKEKYITLNSSTNRRLATIISTTELGDSVTASSTFTGSTQFIRDNPFLELREDIATMLDNALAAIGGLTINQFDCKWRGNFLLEIGDKINLVTKDNGTVSSFLLDDILTYNGTLSQSSKWKYEDNEIETTNNPTNLGEALKHTYAKVDKVNREIDLVASETSANSSKLSSIMLNTESISATVERIEKATNSALESVNGEIATLANKVEAAVTAEEVSILIKEEISNGVDKIVTSTGFSFDDEGLTISKSDSEISTQITEDGMTVYKNDMALLVANNVGVNAANLHATTYLIIGNNSRFEDYGSNRTGCFWIGN
jgi:hypothetical protein